MRLRRLRQLFASPLFLASVIFGTAVVSGLLTLEALTSGPVPSKAVAAAAGDSGKIAASPAETHALVSRYGQLPLYFEKNQGQTAAAVQYLARGAGYTLFLAGDEAVLSLKKAPVSGTPSTQVHDHHEPLHRPAATTSTATRVSVVRAQLIGANKNATVAAEDRLPGHSNYFRGTSSADWHADVAQYARVRYHDIYDGVDLVYYGNQQQLEYDFVVAPGASPDAIRLRYRGIDSASVDATGNLHLHGADGDLVEHKPVIYQATGSARKTVDGRFRLIPQDKAIEVAFEVADYDRTQPLVIDPVLSYAGFLGGSGDDYGSAIAVDSHGAAYVAGQATSTDFPVTTGAEQITYSGGDDCFVSKISADGSTLIYSTYLGGSQPDICFAIAIDSSGAAYVTGQTSSTNFPVTTGAEQITYSGGDDCFVSKISADGSRLVYSTYLGGSLSEICLGIAIDSSGAAYVTGLTSSTNFPVTTGAYQTALGGGEDALVSKLSADGSSLVYSTYLGGSGIDVAYGIAVDSNGVAYLAGGTYSADFPTTSGAYQTVLGGGEDAFVTKLAANGGSLLYSTYLGGTGDDVGAGIAIDSHGSIYVTGSSYQGSFPTTAGAFQTTTGSSDSGFITKLSADGSSLVYSSYLGGSNDQIANSIGVDSTGAAYVTGATNSADFPTVGTPFQNPPTGGAFTFISKFSPDGSSLIYSALLGGQTADWGQGIAVTPGGTAYVTGYTGSANFPATSDAFGTTLNGIENAFVAKITQITLSPATLSFGSVGATTTSAAQTLTLSNESEDTLTISSITTGTTAFPHTTTCGTTLATGASCSIDVSFAPTSVGAASDTLTITTSEAILTAGLSGTGTAVPRLSVSATTLNLGIAVNGSPASAGASLVVTNTGLAALTVTNVAVTHGFTQISNCSASLSPGKQCTITVGFQPISLGDITGTLSIASNAPGGTVVVALSGTNESFPGSTPGGGAFGEDVLAMLALMACVRRRFVNRMGTTQR